MEFPQLNYARMESMPELVGNKSVCLVYNRYPFPMMRGDQLTVAHLIEYFYQRGYSVDFVTLDVDGERTIETDDWLRSRCRTVEIVHHGFLAKLVGLKIGGGAGLPIQVAIFRNRKLDRIVNRLSKQHRYAFFASYYLRAAEAIKNVESQNKVLFMQLSQYLNTVRIRDEAKRGPLKLLYKLEAGLVRKYESRIWEHFNKVGVIGSRDFEALSSIVSRPESFSKRVFLSPHGTNVEKYKCATEEDIVSGRVIFSGNMQYEPNVQAVLWFVDHCWPTVLRERPDAELYIVGKDPDPRIIQLRNLEKVVVTGTVPDVGAYIRSAHVCVNPMRAAGGMQNKLIEYLACGKLIVATSIANEGVLATEEELVIADTPAAFAAEVVNMLMRPLGERVCVSAREFVLRQWTWESCFFEQEKALLS